jgi:HK97 family phage prohead protease
MQIKQFVNFGTQIEKVGNDNYIAGYASVFFDGTEKTEHYDRDLGLYERIAPVAFDKAIRERQVVEARYNHSPDHVLGRTDLGNVNLSTDAKGLKYRIKFNEKNPDHQKVVSLIEDGIVEGSSFYASVGDYKLSGEAITYFEFDLIDVGPVNRPAMTGTGQPVIMSDHAQFKEELDRWKRTREILGT